MAVIFVRFTAKETCTACLSANSEIVPLKNLNKYIMTEMKHKGMEVTSVKKLPLKSLRLSESWLQQNVLPSFMFVFRVHRGQVG